MKFFNQSQCKDKLDARKRDCLLKQKDYKAVPWNLAGKKTSMEGFHITVSIPFSMPKYLQCTTVELVWRTMNIERSCVYTHKET